MDVKHIHNVSDVNSTTASSFSSKKRSLNITNNTSIKRIKTNESVVGKDEANAASAKKILVWNDEWLQFKETPKLDEIKIDKKSSVKWCLNFISKEEGDALFDHLIEELTFERTTMLMRGKRVKLPRLQSWFAKDGLIVKELMQKQKQHVWTLPMRKLKAQLEKQLGVEFDYCLVNLYENGDDYIGFHADNETKDTIASVSLGATRKFIVRHLSCFDRAFTRSRKPLTTPDKKQYEFELSNGSLIVMLDDVQQHWKHSVPKTMKVKAPRINLTFRMKRDK